MDIVFLKSAFITLFVAIDPPGLAAIPPVKPGSRGLDVRPADQDT